jgi:hypothetical protein
MNHPAHHPWSATSLNGVAVTYRGCSSMRVSLLLPVVASAFTRTTTAKSTNASATFAVSATDIYKADGKMPVDPVYPGTAVERLNAVRARVAELAVGDDLNGRWEDVRRKLLWAGGLRDLPEAIPGQVRAKKSDA